jgi:cytochrome c2
MGKFHWKDEWDGRSPRFESEVRQTELLDPSFAGKRKFMCSNCHTMYEAKSKYCPNYACQVKGKTMGELKPLKHTEAEFKRSIDRARNNRGARLPGQGI